MLTIEIPELRCKNKIPVSRSSRRFFSSFSSEMGERIGIVVEARNQVTFNTITIRSVVQIYNHFNQPINIYYKTSEGNKLKLLGAIQEGGGIFSVTLSALYASTGEFYFQPLG